MAVTSDYLRGLRRDLWAKTGFSFIPDRDVAPSSTPPQTASSGPRVAFAGFPSDFSLGFLLSLLLDCDLEVVGLITSPGAHPAILGNNALSRIADHLRIPLLRPWRINDDHSRMDIARLETEAVVMASFNQIVQSKALAIPPQGWLNIHPSLLPENRGPEPVYWAIARGAQRTGITLHRAVPKVDAGPILAQEVVPIAADDTSGTLTRRTVETGVSLLPGAVTRLLRGDEGNPAPELPASYAPSIGHRNLQAAGSAVEAERMVRAGVPNMLAWAVCGDLPVYVEQARLDGGEANSNWRIDFSDGRLELLTVRATCGCHHDIAECPHREVNHAIVA